jgi:vitamin B12 transporter
VVDPCCEKGNPNLVAEESANVELGVGYTGEWFSVELTGFSRKIKNLITIDYDQAAYPDGIIVNSLDEVETQGAELVANARVGKNWNFTFDYTHSDATSDASNEQVDEIPVDLVKGGANWTRANGRFGVGVAINYIGDVYTTIGGGVGRLEHGDYTIVDLSGFAFIDSNLHHRIGVRVENMFDEEYASQLQRTRRDSDGTSYAAWGLGAPLTAHLTYQFRF